MWQIPTHISSLFLQCSIPVFDGLLPKEVDIVLRDLLFTLAAWHAFAKLRTHTETTLDLFEKQARNLGSQLRFFRDEICKQFNTKQLPKEAGKEARARKKASLMPDKIENERNNKGKGKEKEGEKKRDKEKKGSKELNLNFPNFHSLGHYVESIRRFGTIDSYSTQFVSAFEWFGQCIYGTYIRL